MSIEDTLAINLKVLREKNGMNQEQFANKIDVARPTISNWENGKIQPTTDQLLRISKTFSVSIDELFGLKFTTEKWVIADTSALIKRPRLVNELSRRYDKVIVPDVVVSELNHLKDHNKRVKQQAWLTMSSISNEGSKKNSNIFIEESRSKKDKPDDKIIDFAIRLSKENSHVVIHVLSDDVYFSMQKHVPNVEFLSLRNYDESIQEDKSYADLRCTMDFISHVKGKNIIKAKNSYESKKVDPNHLDVDTGYTSLIIAIRNKDSRMVDYLLSLPDVDLNKKDNQKYCLPPISHAIQLKDLSCVSKLVDNGCDIDLGSSGKNVGNTPLMIASWHGLLEIANILLEAGACVNQQDSNGFTPLMKACIRNHPEVVRCLLEYDKVDVQIRDRHGLTARDHAMRSRNDVLRELFDEGQI